MWRVLRFMAGAFVLLLAASRGSAQNYADRCETCDLFPTGPVNLRIPFCMDANEDGPGNTGCQLRFDVSLTSPPRYACAYTGDACLPRQIIRTYQSFWSVQSVFGLTALAYGGGIGCCEPDGTDWCAIWGMPAGCT